MKLLLGVLCGVVLCGDGAALATHHEAGAQVAAVAAPETTSTTALPTTTSTTAAPTTTSTTQAPPVTVHVSVTVPQAAPPATKVNRCEWALETVQASGLYVPSQFDWYCPGPAIDEQGHYRTGLASWGDNLQCEPGNHTPGVGCFIDVDEPHIRSDAYLLNTVAHELCHADEITTNGSSTEAEALSCATQHGF